MPEPKKQIDPADELQRAGEDREKPIVPTENPNHGMERQPAETSEAASRNEDTHARVPRPHEGEDGREGTNEETVQGHKDEESQ